ncbi:MAG: hypothetical protein SOR57_05210 [Parabacteroides sp.]|nr:hypothetical protein [Parabacteroides sp.]
MNKQLVFEESIIYMHDDLDPWAALRVGFDEERNLVFELVLERYDTPEDLLSCLRKMIIIERAGIERLMDVTGSSLKALPGFFSHKYGEKGEAWKTSEVSDTFYKISNNLTRLKIPYQMMNAE